LPRKGFIRVFLLLGYLSATGNKHYQSGFKVYHLVEVELHFVWPLSAELPSMDNPNRRFFYLQPVQLYRSWRCTNASAVVFVETKSEELCSEKVAQKRGKSKTDIFLT